MSIDNRRILIVDDNAAIHQDFKKVLLSQQGEAAAPSAAESALFDDEPAAPAAAAAPQGAPVAAFEVDSAFQGQEALERVTGALREQLPYAMAFVDMRMPPGWDGVETIKRLWEVDHDLQVVVCTAFSDYTWPQMLAVLGRTDRLLILKKPFDAVEVLQLATALTEKWNLRVRERRHLLDVQRAEQEARAYAASLETVNRALQTSWAKADAELRTKSEFLSRVASQVLGPIDALLLRARGFDALEAGDATADLERFAHDAGEIEGTLRAVCDLSDLDSGRLRIERSAFSPCELARAIAERARERGVASTERQVEITTFGSVPDRVVGDVKHVQRVLEELVDNAVRHAGAGRVRIQVSIPVLEHHSRTTLSFCVDDTGPGLSRDDLSRLYEPFCRVDRDGGSPAHAGLGLSLCKRIAIALGGDLSCDSAPGSGARFTLSVPVEVVEAATPRS